MNWHTRSSEDTMEALETSAEGLSDGAAQTRRESVGPNEIETERGRSVARIFLDQFASALIWVLLVAAALSLAVGHVVDAVLIGLILLANGIFGGVQEYRAEQSLDALREMATPVVTVRRAGDEREIPARDLVPGDVVRLGQGDVVPADGRIVDERDLEVDEAALTGESIPVGKRTGTLAAYTPLAERENMVYRGTNVTRGDATAVVVATGMESEMGEIATALIEADKPRTPLQRDLDSLGRRLGVGVAILSALLVPLLVLGGRDLVQAALTAVSLAVAAVPEGLPAVVTLTLALGVRRMADDAVLVRTLPAVEALGAVDVICTDKTGTLTEGEMRVQALWVDDETHDLSGAVGNGGTADVAGDRPRALADDRLDRLLEIGALCNDATVEEGDPTERALVRAASDAGMDLAARCEARPRRDERPFSSERRRMATIHDDYVYVKGAPATVLDRSTRILTADGPAELDEAGRQRVEDRVETLAGNALRVLGFAYKERSDDGGPEENLVFVGLQGLLDPPRAEVADAIAETRRAGIDVKVITGDNPDTARAIAARIGIESAVLSGAEIDDLDDETLRRRVTEVDVFARAEPTHKVRILKALQAEGYSVAMTGDGVNDGPALKNADVGIAMGIRGTEVAQRASDLILLDDDYSSIRTAIKRGRAIFDNIWKFVAYLLSANAAEVAVVVIASLFGYLILPPVQLLWINLLTDGLPALALGTDPAGDVMDREPRESATGIIDRPMLEFIGGAGLVATVVMVALMAYTLDGAPEVTAYAMTMVFTGFVLLEFLKLYVIRWARGTPTLSNRWLGTAVATSLIAQLAVVYSPLGRYFGTVPLDLADWGVLGVTLTAGGLGLLVVGWLLKPRMASGAGARTDSAGTDIGRPDPE